MVNTSTRRPLLHGAIKRFNASRRNVQRHRLPVLVSAVLVLVGMYYNNTSLEQNTLIAPDATIPTESSQSSAFNSLQVEKKRKEYLAVCKSPIATTESFDEAMLSWFAPSKQPSSRSPTPPIACNYTFLDFGSNIGDSAGKFIDSGIGFCSSRNETPKYSIAQGVVGREVKRGGTTDTLTRWASLAMRHRSKRAGRDLYPEDYCFYGVEGNPVFTQRLQQLQERIQQSTPRPLLHAHFFTETVGTKVDGPTTLYLDTVNVDHNFWGSSIHAEHSDVKKSAANTTDKTPVGAAVAGISLTTMIKQTAVKLKGNHLMIKIDIEGAEYEMLSEAYESGILCDYARAGVQVDMVVEIHSHVKLAEAATWKVIEDRFRPVMPGLKKCGVLMYNEKGVYGMR